MKRPFLPAFLFLFVLLRIPAIWGDFALNGAVVALINQETDQVKPLLETAVSQAPQNNRAWWHLGQVLAQTGDVESAVQAWQTTPISQLLLIQYGQIAAKQNPTLAISWFIYAAKTYPTDPKSYYELGQIYQSQKRWAEATSQYQSALEYNPGYLPALVALSQVYLQQNDLDNAEAVLLQLVTEAPIRDPILEEDIYRTLAQIATLRQNISQRVYWWQKAAEVAKTVDSLLHLAESYDVAGQHEKALQTYQQAVTQAPNSPWTHLALAKAYLAYAQGEAALNAVNQAIEIDASISEAWFVAGKIYLLLEQPTEAQKSLAQASLLAPDNSAIQDLLNELTFTSPQ